MIIVNICTIFVRIRIRIRILIRILIRIRILVLRRFAALPYQSRYQLHAAQLRPAAPVPALVRGWLAKVRMAWRERRVEGSYY